MIPIKDKPLYSNTTSTSKKELLKLNLKLFFNFKTNEILAPLLGLLFMIFISILLSPHFLTVKNILSILRQNTMLGLVVLGMMTVILSGCIDLSVGATFALCGIAAGYLKDYNFFIIFICVCALGCFIGFLNGYLIAARKMEYFISTLGMAILLRGICLLVTNSAYIPHIRSFSWLGSGMIGIFPLPVIVLLVFYIFFHVLFSKTVFGKNIYAIGGNETAAKMSGVKTEKTKIAAFVICGLMCALAALINVSRLSAAEPLAGTNLEIDAIAVCLVGGARLFSGRGSIGSAFIGLLIFAVLYNIMNLLGVQTAAQQVAKGLIVIFGVLIQVQLSRKDSK